MMVNITMRESKVTVVIPIRHTEAFLVLEAPSIVGIGIMTTEGMEILTLDTSGILLMGLEPPDILSVALIEVIEATGAGITGVGIGDINFLW